MRHSRLFSPSGRANLYERKASQPGNGFQAGGRRCLGADYIVRSVLAASSTSSRLSRSVMSLRLPLSAVANYLVSMTCPAFVLAGLRTPASRDSRPTEPGERLYEVYVLTHPLCSSNATLRPKLQCTPIPCSQCKQPTSLPRSLIVGHDDQNVPSFQAQLAPTTRDGVRRRRGAETVDRRRAHRC